MTPAVKFSSKELAGFIQGLTDAHTVWCLYIGKQLTCYVRMGMWGFFRSFVMRSIWQGHINQWAGVKVRVIYRWRKFRHS